VQARISLIRGGDPLRRGMCDVSGVGVESRYTKSGKGPIRTAYVSRRRTTPHSPVGQRGGVGTGGSRGVAQTWGRELALLGDRLVRHRTQPLRLQCVVLDWGVVGVQSHCDF